MPSQIPKRPGTRQRRNRVIGAATLPSEREAAALKRVVPALPEYEGEDGEDWHPKTRAWWARVWASPMAGEYLAADMDGLFMLAELLDRFWTEPSAQLAAEIRLQRQCFGLTPIDRRRLQWEVARGEEAEARRKRPAPAAKPTRGRRDPRQVLRMVKR